MMRVITLFVLLSVCLLSYNTTYAQYRDVPQSAVSNVDPKTIVDYLPKAGDPRTNVLQPQKEYLETGTDGDPTRNPLIYKTDTTFPYPTNKWFIDFAFKAITRYIKVDGKEKPLTDTFKLDQSPLTLRALDSYEKNNLGQVVGFPGLIVTATKVPYLEINRLKNALLGDNPQFVLQGDKGEDIGLVMDDEKNIERTVTSKGELHFTTKWQQPNSKSMEALLVRGSPYVTMKYQKVPVILESRQFLVMGVCDEDGQCGDPVAMNPNTPLTGKIFKIIVGKSDNAARTNNNPSLDKIPYSFSVYMLYATDEISLVYEGAKNETGDGYKQHFSDLLKSVNPKEKAPFKKTKNFNGTLRLAFVGTRNGPDDTANINLVELAMQAYRDQAMPYDDNDPNKQHLNDKAALLTMHANVYPTTAELALKMANDSKTAQIVYHWQTERMDQSKPATSLLMMAHKATQLPALQKADANVQVEDFAVATIKGDMQAIVSPVDNEGKATWTQTITIPSVLQRSRDQIWYAKNPLNLNTRLGQKLVAKIKADIELVGFDEQKDGDKTIEVPRVLDPEKVPNDSYGYGKRAARLARIALIAEEMIAQESDAAKKAEYKKIQDKAVMRLKKSLSRWFLTAEPSTDPNGVNHGFFKYDNKFGGMVTARALVNKDTDLERCRDFANNNRCGYSENFYNGQYTDHHFHYGYFLYAAAVLAHLDDAWKQQYRDKVELLIRDIANPSSNDKFFTPYRYFDWFEGHGMANGLGPSASGRDQESTGEAINAWYAITLWGAATQNQNLEDVGKIMTAAAIRAAQTWWQIIPDDTKGVYYKYSIVPNSMFNYSGQGPTALAMKDTGSLGIIWGLQADGATFFGYNSWYRLGIQMLPYTPITEDLFSQNWAAKNSENPNSILNAIQNRMEEKISYLKNMDAALQQYADNRKFFTTDTDDQFWGAFQGRANDPHIWAYLVLPIKALARSADSIEQAFVSLNQKAFEVNQEVNKKSGKDYSYEAPCSGPLEKKKENRAAECLKYTDTGGKSHFIPMGSPLIKSIFVDEKTGEERTDYDGIDAGVSETNLYWWFTTRTTGGSAALPTPSQPQKAAVSDDSADISWYEAGANASYAFKARDAQLGLLKLAKVACDSDNCSGSLIDLLPNTTYRVSIQAEHQGVTSDWSSATVFKTKPKADGGVPSGPSNLVFEASGGGAAGTLSWQASSDPSGTGIMYYVQVEGELEILETRDLQKPLVLQDSNKPYTVSVWAVDGKNQSSPKRTINKVCAPVGAGCPKINNGE